MSLLVRKFAKSKWSSIENKKHIKEKNIPADPITRCLATTQNKLSFWEIKNDSNMQPNEIEEIIKNIVLNINLLSPSGDVGTTHVLLFDKEELKEFEPKQSTAITAFDVEAKHCDISEITMSTLGELSLKIIQKMNIYEQEPEDPKIKGKILTFYRATIKEHLKKKKDIIDKSKITEKIKTKYFSE